MQSNTKIVVAVAGAVAAFFGLAAVNKVVTAYKHQQLMAEIYALRNGEDKTTVHLFMPGRCPLAPSLASPCTKVETFLRLVGVPYVVHPCLDYAASPTGCMPFAVLNGQIITESHYIMEAVRKVHSVHLIDEELSQEDRVICDGVRSMVDYSIRFGFNRSLHLDHPREFIESMAAVAGAPVFIVKFVAVGYQKMLQGLYETTGYMKVRTEQYEYELMRDVETIAALIGTKPFLFGDAPSTSDCAVYAYLLQMSRVKDPQGVNKVFEFVQNNATIRAYVERMTARAFPDLDELLSFQSGAVVFEEEENVEAIIEDEVEGNKEVQEEL